MQQGLRPYVQDENAMALHHPPTLHLKGGGGGGAGGANEIGGALKKGTPGFPTVRKALVNITNSKAGFGSGNSDGGAPGKTPAGVRRALGDITNSNMAAPSAQKAAQKALPLAVRPVPTLQQQQPSAMAAVAALPTSRADVLAEGGVERLAGHSWEQLEAGRVAREEAEIQRRLVSLANFPPRALPTFFPFWVSRGWAGGQSHKAYVSCRWLSATCPACLKLRGLQNSLRCGICLLGWLAGCACRPVPADA